MSLAQVRDRRAPLIELRPPLRRTWREGFAWGVVVGALLTALVAALVR